MNAPDPNTSGAAVHESQLSEAQKRLVEAARRAMLLRREVVELAGVCLRAMQRGDTFDEGDETFEALASGVFFRAPVTRGGQLIGHRWLHLGASEEMGGLLAPYVSRLSDRECEAQRISIQSRTVLRDVDGGRRERCRG